MDILDIDEALKDDSFIFLEEKTHDDVLNILRRWKNSNNNVLPPQQSQQQNEHAFKLNSKTFTRPKRKFAQQSLEAHFANANDGNASAGGAGAGQTPMLNLEIGGLVTNMHKSYLQDTSPPSSICSSSMEMSLERMNNSLITSADFLHTSFLQSTQSFDLNCVDLSTAGDVFNLTDKTTTGEYTFSDMIRDRQALESLTASGDATLIKDSEIAQIDEISLAMSKTASGYSTMDNSTESVESSNGGGVANNRSAERADRTYGRSTVAQRCNLGDDMLIDTSMNLVENSMYESVTRAQQQHQHRHAPSRLPYNGGGAQEEAPTAVEMTPNVAPAATVAATTSQQQQKQDSTLQQTATNITFDCHNNTEERCETPENAKAPLLMYESTPLASAALQSGMKNAMAPILVDESTTLASAALQSGVKNKLGAEFPEVISPIVLSTRNGRDGEGFRCPRVLVLNETYEHEQQHRPAIQQENMTAHLGTAAATSTEFLEDTPNPTDMTYNKDHERNVANMVEMQSVMDLAQAEAELLADNDNEEEFEQMLDNFSRITLKPEQLKMKRSLDTIKRRFISDKSQHAELYASASGHAAAAVTIGSEQRDLNANEMLLSLPPLPDCMRETITLKSSTASSTASNSSSSKESPSDTSSGAERLLSRRSRLYDEFSMSGLGSPCKVAAAPNASAASTSFTVCKHETTAPEAEQKTDAVAMPQETAAMYKLAERRERDRDRFKTMKIVKVRPSAAGGGDGTAAVELNVPCIDDDYDEAAALSAAGDDGVAQRISRRDSPPKSMMAAPTTSTKLAAHTNYVTYKKPKQRPTLQAIDFVGDIEAPDNGVAENVEEAALGDKPRSLSRPRFISGLQKFGLAGKATSAGDLAKTTTTNATTLKYNANGKANLNNTQDPLEQMTRPAPELKSPMGIKSKSFHNLSNNMGAGGNASTSSSGLMAPRASGLRKFNSGGLPTTTTADKTKLNYALRANGTAALQQKTDNSTVFKVPKLVSGLRVPSALSAAPAGGVKRSITTARPSSGYYSLNANAKPAQAHAPQPGNDSADRYSTSDSMSSTTSSRTSQQSGAQSEMALVQQQQQQQQECDAMATTTLTKITTGSTGIPKPSGLRPPSSIKRSALPRPASVVRR